MRSLRIADVCLLIVAGCGGACSGDDNAPSVEPQVVVSGLEMQWKLVPHRLALLDMRLEPIADPAQNQGNRFELRAFNQGGSFGSFDRTRVSLSYFAVASDALTVRFGEQRIEVAPGAKSVSSTVEVDAPGAGALAAILRGVRVSSDEYAAPPSWASRYKPELGYTTAGLGVSIGAVTREGDKARFELSAISRPAACDRADASAGDDMNGTVDMASTWITVHYMLLAVRGGAVTRASADYFLSYPEFRTDGVHMQDAPDAERQVRLSGEPGLAQAIVGVTGFDFVANDPGETYPSCAVKAAPECVGRGRYLRTLRARASLVDYDAQSGAATVDINALLANGAADGAKTFEAGNICVKARGEAVLIQLPDGAVSAQTTAQTPELPNAVEHTQPLDACAGLSSPSCSAR